jgi:hypothetical protein
MHIGFGGVYKGFVKTYELAGFSTELWAFGPDFEER